MNSDILQTYLAIVQTRSLTKTAERMFISQSAVSNRLSSLENELGIRLIERSPGQREIVLTQRGEEFVDFAKRYLELDHRVSNWSKGSSMEIVKVSSVISLTDHILRDFYRQILSSRKLSLVLSTHWTDRIISMLEAREIDVGITPRVFYSKAIAAVPLFDEPIYFVSNRFSSHYPDEVSLQELRRSNEIYFDWGPKFVEWHDNHINPYTPPLIVTDTTEVISDLLCLPDTFSFVPTSVYKCMDQKSLKISRIEPAPPYRTCYLLKVRGQSVNKEKSIAHFERELQQYLRQQENIVLH